MSAHARETKNKFCGALRALLVITAITTMTLPNTVRRMRIHTRIVRGTEVCTVYGCVPGKVAFPLVEFRQPIMMSGDVDDTV